MLLRHHRPRLEEQTSEPLPAFAHLDRETISMLAWLRSSGVEFVLVGPVAAAIRGPGARRGSVAIVPAPYRRNYERLAGALSVEGAVARIEGGIELREARLEADQLARGQLRTLGVGAYSLDIEGIAPGMPSYQELLYEANRFEVAEGVSVEVGSPEDIERYDHLRRTGLAPEIRISRVERSERAGGGPASSSAPGGGPASSPAPGGGGPASSPAPGESGPAPTEAHPPG